ncbi:hypothetical protein KDE13_00015 [Campylobacter sp. faydin G-140]|uniref:hypothetical protein n=1 Tax=Campylobacter anatolicus TaxID=2829105 RepID=UPI001B9ABF2B|nr:hypothetical protein [Campylobacter anatolicus]MBR8464744.1 hypothetical protein [Campylobacter anatolicus]
MTKFKFKRVKRCDICASKLDKKGVCPWKECPSNIAKMIKKEKADKQVVKAEEKEVV